MTDTAFLRFLRNAALAGVVAGATGSIAFMLRVGQQNKSSLLMVMFTVWVLAPFVALVWAHGRSKRWAVLTRATLYVVILIVALASLAIYGTVALGPPRPQPASFFLVVPAASWVLMAVAVSIAAWMSRRPPRAELL